MRVSRRCIFLMKPSVSPLGNVSVGYACLSRARNILPQLLEEADQMLYLAKSSGRNCVLGHADGQSEGEG